MITHDEAKRLADMLRSPYTRQQITDREWYAIADIVTKHGRPAQPPPLDDRDREANRVKRAQHHVAYHVLQLQKAYRVKHHCQRVPGKQTNTWLDDEIKFVVRWGSIKPVQISKSAIRTIMRNGPSLSLRPSPKVSQYEIRWLIMTPGVV